MGSPVKVFTRTSPLMPCAAPITAISTGFVRLVIAAVCSERLPAVQSADDSRLSNRSSGSICLNGADMQQFLIPAKPDLQAAREAWLNALSRERRLSALTVEAYERDSRQLLNFLTDHLG